MKHHQTTVIAVLAVCFGMLGFTSKVDADSGRAKQVYVLSSPYTYGVSPYGVTSPYAVSVGAPFYAPLQYSLVPAGSGAQQSSVAEQQGVLSDQILGQIIVKLIDSVLGPTPPPKVGGGTPQPTTDIDCLKQKIAALEAHAKGGSYTPVDCKPTASPPGAGSGTEGRFPVPGGADVTPTHGVEGATAPTQLSCDIRGLTTSIDKLSGKIEALIALKKRLAGEGSQPPEEETGDSAPSTEGGANDSAGGGTSESQPAEEETGDSAPSTEGGANDSAGGGTSE